MKLFKVTCQGSHIYSSRSGEYTSYVVAITPDEAYQKVRLDLDNRKIGLTQHRELDTIELLAEDVNFPDCGMRLYL